MEGGKTIKVKDIEVTVYKKPIKHMYLSVLPTEGKVRVSVPEGVSDEVVSLFVLKKMEWIKRNIKGFLGQERQTPREYVSGESHYFKGRRYILRVEKAKRPKIEVGNKYIVFYVPEGYTVEQRQHYYENWLRMELQKELQSLVPKWEKRIGVKANEVRIRKMKTKWGTCNITKKRIWINIDLIKKPAKALEYVVVHELLHLIVRNHGSEFRSLMDKYMPDWEIVRRQLNEFIL